MSAITRLETAAVRGAMSAAPREVLTFRLGSEEYAIDLLKVQEIRSYEAPTRIANAPACVNGVVNLRGVIVPIIDLRLKLGLEQAAYDSNTVTVVLNVGSHVVGAVVDSVADVVELAPEQIKPAPEFNGSFGAHSILGLGVIESDDEKRMLIIMDIESLLGGVLVALPRD